MDAKFSGGASSATSVAVLSRPSGTVELRVKSVVTSNGTPSEPVVKFPASVELRVKSVVSVELGVKSVVVFTGIPSDSVVKLPASVELGEVALFNGISPGSEFISCKFKHD